MGNRGLSRPGLNAAIAGGIALAGAIGIGVGALIWRAEGQETTLSAALIGIGLFAAILGAVMCANFLWGVAVIRRIREGRDLVARWRVTPEELDRFRAADAARSAHGPDYHSDWTPPDPSPAEGLEVRFAPDAVLIGGDYFGLSSTGFINFSAVKRIADAPASLEFRVNRTEARGATVQRLTTVSSLLRVPVSPAAPEAAARALDHFERVMRREIIVNPGMWTVRIRIGLWTAAIAAIVAVSGWLWPKFTPDPDHIGDAIMGCGIIIGLGGLALAGGSYVRFRAQMGR